MELEEIIGGWGYNYIAPTGAVLLDCREVEYSSHLGRLCRRQAGAPIAGRFERFSPIAWVDGGGMIFAVNASSPLRDGARVFWTAASFRRHWVGRLMVWVSRRDATRRELGA